MTHIHKNIKLGKYRHYKGKEYEVVGIAKHSETLEDVVVYRALYQSEEFGDNALWVRPVGMFLEKVMVDSSEVSRFEYIKN
jgi:hypothetical protein